MRWVEVFHQEKDLLVPFFRAVVTKYHKMAGLNNNVFPHNSSLQAGSSKIKVWTQLSLSEGYENDLLNMSLLSSGGLLAIFGIAWLIEILP